MLLHNLPHDLILIESENLLLYRPTYELHNLIREWTATKKVSADHIG